MSAETWNIVRFGEVVAVDYAAARVRVHFDELQITSDPLPVLQRGAGSLADYHLPSIGDSVVCLFYSDGTEEGVCVGAFYPAGSPPPESGSGKYYTKFPDGSSVTWNNGELTIAADSVSITAETTISGNATINGNLNVSGVVTALEYLTA